MSKDSTEKPKKNSFSNFLKKRAPIYLGLTGLFVIFAVPGLTSTSLESLFPELTEDEKQILDTIMEYNGPDGDGFTILQAIDEDIKEEFEDDRIYSDRLAQVAIDITTDHDTKHIMAFTFAADQKEVQYVWGVDVQTGQIEGQNDNAKNMVNLVDFYD